MWVDRETELAHEMRYCSHAINIAFSTVFNTVIEGIFGMGDIIHIFVVRSQLEPYGVKPAWPAPNHGSCG